MMTDNFSHFIINCCEWTMTDGFTINVGLAQAHPNYTVLKRENNMKSISIINPAIMENTEYSIVRVLPSY